MQVTKKDLETIVYGTANKPKHLQGMAHVRFEPGRLIVTNGLVLILREVTAELGEDFEPFLVSVADIKSAIRANAELWKENGEAVVVDPGDDFMAKIGRKTVVKQDAQFPDWQKVLVKKDKSGQKMARFTPSVMMSAIQGVKDIASVEFRMWDADAPVRLDGITEDGRKVMCLVMPVIRK